MLSQLAEDEIAGRFKRPLEEIELVLSIRK